MQLTVSPCDKASGITLPWLSQTCIVTSIFGLVDDPPLKLAKKVHDYDFFILFMAIFLISLFS